MTMTRRSYVLLFIICYFAIGLHCVNGRKHKQYLHRTAHGQSTTPPNILQILADDLGYGDTNVSPFVGLGIKTPGLERMASKGTILTNYHTAAATCTPTRASILTGMYPWRLGIKSVFEYGKPAGQSNRDDWLVQVPTIPMVLREANYSVTHSGKWHLGGMRNDDYDMRQLPHKPPNEPGGRRCPHPGPNQQGFKNYISMLDGPGSPRQNRLQLKAQLYSQGCTALLHNDIDISQNHYNTNTTSYLSYCEAEHAIAAMNRSVAKGKPFYVQLWFHAPHSPLEEIPGWHEKLTGISRTKNTTILLDNQEKFRTMVADMDDQILRILKVIENLGIEDNTLVVFTSDNGPEPFAGSRAGLKGAKRYLYEGGIRVPALVQWTGTVPAGQVSDAFVVSTDLFPTFLDAAGVMVPQQVRLDGLSFLPLIVPNYYKVHMPNPPATSPILGKPGNPHGNTLGLEQQPHTGHIDTEEKHQVDVVREDPELYHAAMRDRVTLWHNDYEGPRRTAAWVYDFKIILNEQEIMSEMYDMRTDKYEKHNLLEGLLKKTHTQTRGKPSLHPSKTSTNNNHHSEIQMLPISTEIAKEGTKPGIKPTGTSKVTLKMIETDRSNPILHVYIASHMYSIMRNYVKYGNNAHIILKNENPGWVYTSTITSQFRADHIRGNNNHHNLHNILMNNTCKNTLCSCDIKTISEVKSLPFEKIDNSLTYLHPGKLLNAIQLLQL